MDLGVGVGVAEGIGVAEAAGELGGKRRDRREVVARKA